MWGKQKPDILLVGMEISADSMGISKKDPQKFQNRTTEIPTYD